MIRPDHAAQMRAPVLDVWASLNGYAVGFVGGAYREVIAEQPTWDAAFELYRAAQIATRPVRCVSR